MNAFNSFYDLRKYRRSRNILLNIVKFSVFGKMLRVKIFNVHYNIGVEIALESYFIKVVY